MFSDIKNNIDFFIRNKTKFSRKNFIEKDINKIERNYYENLYIQDVLEKCFLKKNLKYTMILDVGSKNWFYAKGEYNFFKNFCTNFLLDGVELDAYRLYTNFYSRYEVGRFY